MNTIELELTGSGIVGKNAYELAVQQGFVGTLEDYLLSLKGEQGEQGIQGLQGLPGIDGVDGQDGAPAGIHFDVFNWTGSQDIADGAFFDLGGLVLVKDTTLSDLALTRASTAFVFPEKTQRTDVTIRTRLTGTVGGAAGTAREFYVQSRRIDGTTIVGSASTAKITGSSISNRDEILSSYTAGATDRFTTEGVILGIFNDTGATLTLTSLNLLFKQIG